jgi:hypothetical protein
MVEIADVLVGTRTEHFSNSSLESYRFTNLLSLITSFFILFSARSLTKVCQYQYYIMSDDKYCDMTPKGRNSKAREDVHS